MLLHVEENMWVREYDSWRQSWSLLVLPREEDARVAQRDGCEGATWFLLAMYTASLWCWFCVELRWKNANIPYTARYRPRKENNVRKEKSCSCWVLLSLSLSKNWGKRDCSAIAWLVRHEQHLIFRGNDRGQRLIFFCTSVSSNISDSPWCSWFFLTPTTFHCRYYELWMRKTNSLIENLLLKFEKFI